MDFSMINMFFIAYYFCHVYLKNLKIIVSSIFRTWFINVGNMDYLKLSHTY